jgi:glycerol-3-phosphate dehydrogenase subunit B
VGLGLKRELHFDVAVIGAGMAGLTAAVRLAEGGARVCVLAKGAGSTHLAPATIDVLGYAPERVEDPGHALGAFAAAHPEHPYAVLGTEHVGPALEWFAERVAAGPQPGYRYVGSLDRNHLLPTAAGAVKPSALVPETMAAGDLAAQGDVCVVGIRALRDFHPTLMAANLTRAGVPARGVELDLDVGRPEANALGLARRFDDAAFRAAFAGLLAPHLRTAARVAVPAVVGLRDPHGAWQDLQRRLDRPVFEVPTLPPSAPGLRVWDVLRRALTGMGGRIVMGAEVVGAERDGARVTAVRAHTSGQDTTILARSFVLATGGVASGAVALGSDWVVREAVLGLEIAGAVEPGQRRFHPEYFAEHPLGRVGVAVDGELRPHGVENVRVVGAALAGAAPWREGSGEGIALTSGHRAAALVLAEEGVRSAA